jgi:predicted TIM-barrel fold metal-dependent hydrolase
MSTRMTRRGFNGALCGATAFALSGCAKLPVASRLGAIDSHAHVFHRDLPMPDKRRAPAGYDAPPEDYLRVLAANGMTHGVLVQPSFLGADNSYLVASLRKFPDRLRGIAVVDPGIGSEQLQALQDAGVVGIRLNLIGLPTPDFASTAWRGLLSEVRTRRWQVEVHQSARDLRAVLDPLIAEDLNVVVDHFGRPDAKLGVDDPGFRYLLTLGPSRKVWVKLSGAYRNGLAGQGEATALAAMPLLRASFGLDRLVWGSDWPHTLFEKTVDYPTQRRLLDEWLPTPLDRTIVLRETPARLFGFAN